MSSRKRRKSRYRRIKIVWLLVVILAVVAGVLVFRERIADTAKQKAAGVVMEQISKQAEKLPAGAKGTVMEVYGSLEEEDKQKVNEIIADSVDADTVQEVTEYVENGNMKGLQQYVQENLSDENSETLQELYEKYKDKF